MQIQMLQWWAVWCTRATILAHRRTGDTPVHQFAGECDRDRGSEVGGLACRIIGIAVIAVALLVACAGFVTGKFGFGGV